jgi:hypothetical protein
MVLSLILASLLATWSCSVPHQRQYEIERLSPSGSYRVRIMVKRGEPGKTLDEAGFQFLKAEEIVDSWEWKQEDQYDENFDSLLPIQWVSKQVLHIGGRGSSNANFADELNVINATGEPLKIISISYRKSDIFKIFDLDREAQINLTASPWFTVNGGDFSFGYSGMTQSGKQLNGIIRLGERVYPDGPRKISITISRDQIQ